MVPAIGQASESSERQSSGWKSVLVHIVADYGAGNLAFAEVVQRIKRHLPNAEPALVPVPPFFTVAAGFCIAQLGLHPAPPGVLIYHNVVPPGGRPGVPTRERKGRLGLCAATDTGPGDRGEFCVGGLRANGRDSLLFGRPFSSRGGDPKEALSGPSV
ncbi:MAG: hypothetical protein ABIU05_25895 [Nitrospirales bacterium]